MSTGSGYGPQPLTIGAQVGQTLGAEGQTQAAQFSNDQAYQPLYTGLQTQSLQDLLLGANGSGGYLSTMATAQPQISATQNAATTAASQGNITNLANLGPQALAALRSSNPQIAQLMDALNSQTLSQVQAGSSIDPELASTLRQNFRGGLAARGMGTGTGDAGLEAYYMANQGNALRTQRFAQGSALASLMSGVYGGPTAQLATGGQPANVSGTGAMALSAGNRNLNPMTFDPFNQYASNNYDTAFNAATSNYNSAQNNKSALWGSLIGAGSKIGGAAIGAA